jgi:lipid-A-disaccharide synthase
MRAPPCILLTAVEPSGDELGASLMRALRRELGPETRFVGVGGAEMAREGLASPFDPSDMAVVGAFNAIAAWPRVRARAREAAAIAVRGRPDVAVLIDAWGFSIRVATRLREVAPDLPIVKFVGPQVWATRPGRARTLARKVDRLLTIHAFDAPWFERWGLKTTFVGNPVLGGPVAKADPKGLRRDLGLAPDQPLLLVLPGSRGQEVRRLMGPFGDAARRLQAGRPDLAVVVVAATGVAPEVRVLAARWARPPMIVEGEAARLSAMRAATLALACSGTVTTQLAMAGCPMVVGYRLGPFTYLAARLLLRTRYITLFNVAAGKLIATERLQGRCAGRVLARDLARLLDDPARAKAQAAAQTAALEMMRGGVDDPLRAAAAAIAETVAGRRGGSDGQPRDSSGV